MLVPLTTGRIKTLWEVSQNNTSFITSHIGEIYEAEGEPPLVDAKILKKGTTCAAQHSTTSSKGIMHVNFLEDNDNHPSLGIV